MAKSETESSDKADKGAPKPSGPKIPAGARLTASVFPGTGQTLPGPLAAALSGLQSALGLPLVVLLQCDPHEPRGTISGQTATDVIGLRNVLKRGQPVALVLNSFGGDAGAAYAMARFLQRHCGGFTAVVPRQAKSAATLLALGAKAILLGENAELGPLDVQIFDPETEDYNSALNEQQALERLLSAALEAIDRAVVLVTTRSGKKVNTVLPLAMRFSAEWIRPLVEKIDAVHYTQVLRALKIGEEYARRLLEPEHGGAAARIARTLVHSYPDHSFIIDIEEARALKLKIHEPTSDTQQPLADLFHLVADVTAIGLVQEGHP